MDDLNNILSKIDKQVSHVLLKNVDKYTKLFIVNNCKKYYLTEIERLSYVYKNICNSVN